jgi:hypothetical protein
VFHLGTAQAGREAVFIILVRMPLFLEAISCLGGFLSEETLGEATAEAQG